jgi:hypothetical protein
MHCDMIRLRIVVNRKCGRFMGLLALKSQISTWQILIKPSGVSLLARLIRVDRATLPDLGAYPVSLL